MFNSGLLSVLHATVTIDMEFHSRQNNMALVQVVALTLILFQGQPTTNQRTIPLHTLTLRRSSVICSATHDEES